MDWVEGKVSRQGVLTGRAGDSRSSICLKTKAELEDQEMASVLMTRECPKMDNVVGWTGVTVKCRLT